jgi:hypothetical protein
MSNETIFNWSNAKKARLFAHIIAHLLADKGGEARVPLNVLQEPRSIGFDIEDGVIVMAVDMDGVHPSTSQVMEDAVVQTSAPRVDSFEALELALEETKCARACITQNRGYDKEMACEGYESCVADGLVPALLSAVESAVADLEPREVERLAAYLLHRLKR